MSIFEQSYRKCVFVKVFVIGVLLTSMSGLADTGGLDAPEAVGPYFNNIFPPLVPGQAGDWTVELAFPHLNFEVPMFLVPYPGTKRLVILEKSGIAYTFEHDPNATTKEVFLDIRSQVFNQSDSGMTGIAFHPEFGQPDSPNRYYVYLTYKWTPEPNRSGDEAYWRLSRFTVPDGQQTADPSSELILIQQYDRQEFHDSGCLLFGSDGFLYVGIGDEGGRNDEFNVAQQITERLFSGILRIDVDQDPARSHPIRRQPAVRTDKPGGWPDSFTQGYGIPNDNPFVDPNGGNLEEFYAIGLRNPYKFHQDPNTDLIWVGDLGQNAREELDVLIKGGNYQWAFKEGSIDGPKDPPDTIFGTQVAPSWDYARDLGNAIIAGPVYDGIEHPSLRGKVIVVDNGSNNIWAVTTSGVAVTDVELLSVLPGRGLFSGTSMVGQDANGEVLFLKLRTVETGEGGIYKLARAGQAIAEPPTLLSQTGVFTDLATLTPAPGVIPYTVNAPFWSDNAVKTRWIILPNDGVHDTPSEKIGFRPDDNWAFPPGTVFVKHFELPVDEANPLVTERIETRFVVMDENGGAYGVTYQWLDDQSDAILLSGADSKDFTITLANGGTQTQHWEFPSRLQCMICHNQNAGYVLGVRTHQLNSDLFYPRTGRVANQLRTLGGLGWFDETYDETLLPSYLKAFSILDTAAPVVDRVRSYLDSNCSQCHRPEGVRGYFDARYPTPIEQQNLIYGPLFGGFVAPEERVIVPGAPDLSILYYRSNRVGDLQMPPLAKNLVDTSAMQVIQEWIASLPPNPGVVLESQPVVTGAFSVSVTFTTAITDLIDSDFLITNGLAGQLTDSGTGQTYQLAVMPDVEGPVTVFLPKNSVTDASARGNYASNLLTVYHSDNSLVNQAPSR